VNTFSVRKVRTFEQIMRPHGLFKRNLYYSWSARWHVNAAQLQASCLGLEVGDVSQLVQNVLTFLTSPTLRWYSAVSRIYADGAMWARALF